MYLHQAWVEEGKGAVSIGNLADSQHLPHLGTSEGHAVRHVSLAPHQPCFVLAPHIVDVAQLGVDTEQVFAQIVQDYLHKMSNRFDLHSMTS